MTPFWALFGPFHGEISHIWASEGVQNDPFLGVSLQGPGPQNGPKQGSQNEGFLARFPEKTSRKPHMWPQKGVPEWPKKGSKMGSKTPQKRPFLDPQNDPLFGGYPDLKGL